MEYLYESKKTKILVSDDGGGIIKQTSDSSEYKIFDHLKNIKCSSNFEYVANCYAFGNVSEENIYILFKEKIEESLLVQNNIVSLCAEWDKFAKSAYSLFDHIERYLPGADNIKYGNLITVEMFLDRQTMSIKKIMQDMILLVEELAHYKIYNIDWHPGNFGLKNGHLALFELGGAKIR